MTTEETCDCVDNLIRARDSIRDVKYVLDRALDSAAATECEIIAGKISALINALINAPRHETAHL